MAGDLIIDKVAKTSVATKVDLVRSLPKAWINLNGTGTIATRSSLNVASTIDGGVGNYGTNFASAFSSGSYVPKSTNTCNDYAQFPWSGTFIAEYPPTASSCPVFYRLEVSNGVVPTDPILALMEFTGDLA